MPINDSVYNYNANTATVSGGTTINGQTFATAGTYTVTPTFYYTTGSTPSYARANLSWGGNVSSADDSLIEALFTLKPRLRKKYKGDTEKFRTDLLDAAQQRKEEDATRKLSDLLGIEGDI